MSIFPVIESTISASALGDFAKAQYNLNSDFDCKLFRTGMNHTYFLSDTKSTYVLRVYSHNWRSKAEIKEELELLQYLSEHQISVSTPIPNKNGDLIQEIAAPEGNRFVVLFSFATGDKVRFMDTVTCGVIGELIAKMHKLTLNKSIKRESYNKQTLLTLPYDYLQQFFSTDLDEMKYIKTLQDNFKASEFETLPSGVVHLDIWYDNMAIKDQVIPTIFDFDFCGNGAQILDVAYFCKQLFSIEADKAQYEDKMNHFLQGYQKHNPLCDAELQFIPQAGAAVYVFYLGVQARRFDWSNIFLTENYLKMSVGRIKAWNTYYQTHDFLRN